MERIQRVLDDHVERGDVVGVTWLVAVDGEVHTGAAGTGRRDTIYRIASMTKPITAVAALLLVEECRLRLDDPIDDLLPELADRRVLVNPEGPLDDTVPAARPITVRDALTFRLGLGVDFAAGDRPQPVLDAVGELGMGNRPPAPAEPPPPDEWIRRLGTVPLSYQPGERWLYHVGSEVLGVLVARAAGQPFEDVLRERVFEPLGMHDTGFHVPPSSIDRFGPSYTVDPETGDRAVFDEAGGQWSRPPAFPSGGGGLVSTVDDYLAFAAMLLRGGAPLLARPTVAAMTMDHLTTGEAGPDIGWGFGVGVQRRRTGTTRSAGSYGWDGGLGTSWVNDPAEDLVGIVLTNQAYSSPAGPQVVADFWTCAYASLS